MVTALALAAWASLRALLQGPQEPIYISSPYVYEYQYDDFNRDGQRVSLLVGHLRDLEEGQSTSFYPYTHLNADCRVPLFRGESGTYTVRNILYEFQVVEGKFCVLSTQFYASKHWRELFEEDGTVYERRLDGHWPFQGRSTVLELPEGASFYDPIAIPGLGGCGILLLSTDDPGNESDIRVYIRTDKGWCQAKFSMPDGTQRDFLQGYVRRQEDITAESPISSTIGNMEVCVKNQSGRYALYNVVYSDGMLALEETQAEVTAEDLRGWMY